MSAQHLPVLPTIEKCYSIMDSTVVAVGGGFLKSKPYNLVILKSVCVN